MVLALQGEAALSRLSAESTIPQIVAISILRELGPVVAGLMLAGRVGSSIAAELSTMRVNEQVDALTTMSIDPWHYLIAPRVLAALIALPVLVVVANVIGIGGGYLIAVFQLDFDGTRFLTTILGFIQPQSWALSLTKALIFGAIVGLFGCYMGFNARGGAQGVGLATTNAVVASSIALLLADLVITLAFFRLVGEPMTQIPKAFRLETCTKILEPHRFFQALISAWIKASRLAILGRSGTGKSVLFKCIVGLMTPEQGDVSIDGQSLSTATSRQREALLAKIAVVFQGSALFDSLNVWRNVMFTRMMSGGTSKKDLMGRAEALLQKVGLNGDDLTKAPSELSSGMQKRVAIARALAQDPDLIFFDEPTTGLDPVTAGTIDDLIADVVTSTGVTAVTITHDLSTARLVADEALFLDNGQVQWRGPVGLLDRNSIPDTMPPILQQFLSDRSVTRG